MTPEVLVGLVSAILGTGIGSSVTSVLQGRSTARKMDAETMALGARTPAEVDSIALQGAESAVRVLQQTNETLVSENTRLFTENGRLRSQLEQMEGRLEQMRHRAETAERALATASEALAGMQSDYEALSAEIQTFRTSSGPTP